MKADVGSAPRNLFIGREVELVDLESVLSNAWGGDGEVVVIEGEAGVGKTTLVREVADRVARRGGAVSWARCWEGGGAPPFWPWVPLVRELSGAVGTSEALKDVRAHLTPLDPGVMNAQQIERDDSGQARFAMFDAVSQLVSVAGEVRPQLMVIDDLHAADPSSLQLLRFLVPRIRQTRCILIATSRGASHIENDATRSAFVEAVRGCRSIGLRAIDKANLGVLAEALTGTRPTTDAIDLLYETTGGNPFFATELILLLRREGRLGVLQRGETLPLPESVRAVVARRFERIEPPLVRALATLATNGREIERALAEAVTDDRDVLDQAVAVARAEGLLEAEDGSGVYRFSHSLVGSTLYASLSPRDRGELHWRLGVALENLYAGAVDKYLAKLALHFSQVPGESASRKAYFYAIGAAARAFKALAFEEAADHYVRALERAPGVGASEEDVANLLIALAEARIRGGRPHEGREIAMRAWDTAGSLEITPLMARIALVYALPGVEGGIVNDEVVRMIDRVLPLVPEEDLAVRSRLRARLCGELWSSPNTRELEDQARRSLAEARASTDDRALIEVLRWTASALARPPNIPECLRLVSEMIALARSTDDVFAEADGLSLRLILHSQLGDARALDEDVARLSRLKQRVPVPLHCWFIEVNLCRRALMTGEFDIARSKLADASGFFDDVPNAMAVWHFQQFLLSWETGGIETFEPFLDALASQRPGLADMARSAICLIHAESGASELARRELHELADGVSQRERPWIWLLSLAFLAQAADVVQDRTSAGILYDSLLPHRDHHVAAAGRTAAGYWGSVERLLANLSFVTGDLETAAAHGELALIAHAKAGAKTFFARSQFELSRILRALGKASDDARAEALAAEAYLAAERLGMERLTRAIEAQKASDAPAAKSQTEASIAFEGDYWTFRFDGNVTRIKDGKGVRYLVELLSRPEAEVHVLELATPDGRARGKVAAEDALSVGEVDTPLLDETAKSQYRQRIQDLQEEVAEAEDYNDTERAAKLQAELDQLVQTLSAALGLAGRDRSLGRSSAEQARVNVTKQVRATIKRLAKNDRVLGSHLESAVKTGVFCSYRPPATDTRTWSLER